MEINNGTVNFSTDRQPASPPIPPFWGGREEGLLFLKLQCNISRHIEPGHWDESDLRVAVFIRMPVMVEDGTVNPSAGSIMTVEDIVEVHAEHGFFQAGNVPGGTQGVADIDVRL